MIGLLTDDLLLVMDEHDRKQLIDAKDVWDPFKTERCSFFGRLMIFTIVFAQAAAV